MGTVFIRDGWCCLLLACPGSPGKPGEVKTRQLPYSANQVLEAWAMLRDIEEHAHLVMLAKKRATA